MLNAFDTVSTSTIVSVVPVPQNQSSDSPAEAEALSALFACPAFVHGFALGQEVCEKETHADDIPHNEKEVIAFVNHELSAHMYQRGKSFSQMLGCPPLSYFAHLGFVVGYLNHLLAHYPLHQAHSLADTAVEREHEQPQAILAHHKAASSSGPKYPNRLRVCLKQAGYTLREIAEETDIPYGTLLRWSAGRQIIPQRERERLADLIGCSVEDLAPRRIAVSV